MGMRPGWLVCLLMLAPLPPQAQTGAPWGGARDAPIRYAPARVLYDVDKGGIAALNNILDRVSLLNKLYEADPFESSIVVVVHGDAIPLFGIRDHAKYRDVMQRAQSLTQSGMIEFRLCRAAAGVLGYRPADIHGFVRMVPMADAEIVRLQNEGYAYMR
ncbi:MAG TPA: DsrE family protein [Burkholderiaceae bacterium]|jgi:intracellular sulfur oxidation DsrE/DsrF family protein|nr:DsrE family protein [Burkholderiaceae bacterium]